MDGKQKVGLEAAGRVRSGMIVGLGTGSTATYFIQELGRRIKTEGLAIHGVPSSFACFELARKAGIPLLAMDQIDCVDLYADGADEVDPHKGLLKGRGAAMLGEKLLADAADRFLVLVDEGKLVQRLGTRFPVPVETLRPAGGKDGPVVTDAGNLVLDAVFPPGADWRALDAVLDAQPGVVGHGLFLRYAAKSEVLVGGADGGMRIIP